MFSGNIIWSRSLHDVPGGLSLCLYSSGILAEVDSTNVPIAYCTLQNDKVPVAEISTSNLRIYYDSNDLPKYYILQLETNVFIVRRKDKSLEVSKIFSDISKFGLRDFKNNGFPILRVFDKFGEYTDIDFTLEEVVREPTADTAPSYILRHQIELAKRRNKATLQVLSEKKELVCELIAGNMACPKASMEQNTSGINVIDLHLNNIEQEADGHLSCGDIWLKIYNDVVIVGLRVANKLDKEICDLRLCPLAENWLVYETKLWMWKDLSNSQNNCKREYLRVTFLPPGSEGYIVGLLKECIVLEPMKVNVILAFDYKNFLKQDSLQEYIGDFEITPMTSLSLQNCTFECTSDVSDLLSVLTVCDELPIHYLKPTNLQDILLTAGFHRILDRYFFSKISDNSPFKGILLELNEEKLCLNAYYKNVQQLAALLLLLCQHTILKPKGLAMINGFYQELKYLESYVQELLENCVD